jgi:hypothetical protein
MKNSIRCSLFVSLATALAASAGTFTNALNSGLPAGTALYATTSYTRFLTNDLNLGSCLLLTTNLNSQGAGFILSDLDAGAQIGSLVASFQVDVGNYGNGATTYADGFSFNFAPDLPNSTISEAGAGTGITVEFHTYDSGPGDNIGIDLKFGGTEFVTDPTGETDSQLCQYPYYVPVFLELTTNGTMNVTYDNTTIYSGQAVTGFTNLAGRFGFGARCGGEDEICAINNLGITTGPPALPQFMPSASAPTGSAVRPDPLLIAMMWDGWGAQVATNTIVMTLNGATVTPAIAQTNGVIQASTGTQTNAVTTLHYHVSPVLGPGTTNTVVVTFSDNEAPPVSYTNTWSFVVTPYATIPATYRATADTTSPGFTHRVFQGGTATLGTIHDAENLLAGFLINPATGQPFPNTAGPGSSSALTFVNPTNINYNISAPAAAGDFTNATALFPGIPGTNASTVNFAVETITYLYLSAGAYTFCVNSDDGFKLSCLAAGTFDANGNGPQLGVYDAGRGAADTIFSFAVAQTGYYPLRLVYFQGIGAASLQWFSITPSGQKILINDTNTPGYVPAYSRATSAAPYFLGTWPGGTANRPDQPVRVQMQDGVGFQVNPGSIHLAVNGANVTPTVTKSGGLTTLQYTTLFASASANTAMVWFADNEVSPVSQTNTFTFSVITYTNLPASYALSAAAVDLTKPGFAQRVFQTDQPTPYSIANAEIMLAGQLTDAAGNPYPNKATPNTDGSYNYNQTNVINYNLQPGATGDFTSNDLPFPGIPGVAGSTNTFALEAITYLYLPVGYYVLGVNSDDGFRLTTALNPHEEFPTEVAVYDGTRSAADTTGAFGITQAGYYPFRLVYFQATGPASLEVFNVALSGQKILVNNTNTPGCLQAYRSATDTQPYVQWAYPYRAMNLFVSANSPLAFTLVNGTPAIQLGTIAMSINGAAVLPTVTEPNSTNIVVSFVPSAFQQTTNTTATVQLVWEDASGHWNTDTFSFTLYGTEALAPAWNILPGYQPYLTSSDISAGLGYNPATTHLVLGYITNASSGSYVGGFYLLDALTGTNVGQLKLTNASGTQIFAYSSTVPEPGFSVGVAADGAIYAANKTSLSFLHYYQIYRWGSESDFPKVVFNNKFSFDLGGDFRVRGAGTNTQIIVGAGNGSTPDAVLFTTTDGTNLTASTLSVSGVTDLYAGIGFGSNNTLYAEGYPTGPLQYVSYDPVAKTGSALASYNCAAPSGSFGPLGVDLANGRIIALAASGAEGTNHTVNLFDIAALDATPGVTNSPISSVPVPSSNANSAGSGSVVFTPSGNMAFVLDTDNGLMAYDLSLPSQAAPVTPIITGISVSGGTVTIHFIGGASDPASDFTLISSARSTPLSSYSPASGANITGGSGSYVATVPASGSAQYYRIKR